MFCPDCGLEDKQSNQFCRACGTDLRPVRYAREKPDNITASAASARDEIGRAVAAKIRESRNPEELAVVAEDVLPEIEKFLESPEEKRMRRMRSGMVLSCIGLGTAAGVAIVSFFITNKDFEFLFLISLAGVVTSRETNSEKKIPASPPGIFQVSKVRSTGTPQSGLHGSCAP
jgi:hypothetical protein